MAKATISFKDGDSGEMIDERGKRRFRLSNVDSPEKIDAGYGAAKLRATRLVPEGSVVDIKVVGKDAYGRSLIKINKNGRAINEILERQNALFRPKTRKP